MILVGTVMAMANGIVLPLMCIVFGDMTDSFVSMNTSKLSRIMTLSKEGTQHLSLVISLCVSS